MMLRGENFFKFQRMHSLNVSIRLFTVDPFGFALC